MIKGVVLNLHGHLPYGDCRHPHPPSATINAVKNGDVAVVWGPKASYFGAQEASPLIVEPVLPSQDGSELPMAFNILPSLPAAPGIREDPVTKVRGLIALWSAQWGTCERFSDVPIELGRLRRWIDDIALFDLLDYGMDFRARMVGRNLVPLLGRDWSGSKLSELPSPCRQDLRRVLLCASMLREPVAVRYDWLVESRLWSCTACAMPVAGELFQPTRLLVGIFYTPQPSNPIEMADFVRVPSRRPQASAADCSRDACCDEVIDFARSNLWR